MTVQRHLRTGFFACLVILATIIAGHAQTKASRLAFVVGNAGYAAGPLATAANDAGLVAGTLALAGFDVSAVADANSETLQKAADSFIAKAQAAAGPNTEIVVYMSGYGLQAGGDNFIVPVDMPALRDVDIAPHAFRLTDLTTPLQGINAKARLFIFDLARATPFTPASDGLANGLAAVEAQPGSLIAINTAPGTVAPTDIGIYGIYARSLSNMLREPNLSINEAFDKLRLRVAQVTNGTVIPWDDSKLPASVSLAPPRKAPAEGPTAAIDRPLAGLSPDIAFYMALARDTLDTYDAFIAAFPASTLLPNIRTLAATRREGLIWAACAKANQPQCYWTYMRRYPHGPHLYDSKQKLAALHATLEPPPRFDVWNFGALGLPSSDELTILARHPLTSAPLSSAALPSPPEGLMPPRVADTETPFPPLAVAGALPVAMPTLIASGTAPGSIAHVFVPGFEGLTTTFGTAPVSMVTARSAAPLTRTEIGAEQGHRVVTQKDASGAIVSRSVTSQARDGITTVQTGPGGGVIAKSVTTLAATGGRGTTILNGRNELIAAIDQDKNGVRTSVKSGSVPIGNQRMIFKPAQGARTNPSIAVAPLAMAKDLPPLAVPPPEPPPPPPKIDPPAEPAPPVPATPSTEAAPAGSAADVPVAPKPDDATTASPASDQDTSPALPVTGPTPPQRPRDVRAPHRAGPHGAVTGRRGALRPRFRVPHGRRR